MKSGSVNSQCFQCKSSQTTTAQYEREITDTKTIHWNNRQHMRADSSVMSYDKNGCCEKAANYWPRLAGSL